MIFYETASGNINAIEFASKEPRADTLLCIHGLCCDARVFAYVGQKLSGAGYNVVSIDLPGHNFSDGEKGDHQEYSCLHTVWAAYLRCGMRICSRPQLMD